MIRIIGVGDVMPGGLLNSRGGGCISPEMQSYLSDADIRVGTLECALGNEPTYDKDKVADRGNVIYAKDEDICRLKELQLDIVSLANNHFFDLGVDGAIHTIELLNRNNIRHCGAGCNLKEASKPVVVKKDGKSIAFLAFCDTEYKNVYWCTYATDNAPGVNPMEVEHVRSEIEKCKSQYDYVVVLAHWGCEHTFNPNVSTFRMASLMRKAGADIIIGSHPHRVQPVVKYKHACVAYSLGNFLFPERLIAPPKVTFYPEGPIDLDKLPVTDGYPTVETVTLKTLPFLARLGMAVKIDVEDLSVDFTYTYLDKNNMVDLADKTETAKVNQRLKFLAIPIRLNIWGGYIFVRKYLLLLRRGIRKIKRILFQ